MDDQRRSKAQALFLEAEGLPAEARSEWLDQACAGDAALKEEVEILLGSASGTRPSAWSEPFTVPGGNRCEDMVAGTALGPWLITRLLGRGGMGEVYEAQRADGTFELRAAAKLLKRGLDTDAVVARFNRERRILAQLDHSNIARVLDAGVAADGRPFLVMEYVDGKPITEYAASRDLSTREILRLMITVCEAVQAAHFKQIVHRDLKPSNVLVTARGQVKLLDFGIAKALAEDNAGDATLLDGSSVMTPAYASPEQLLGAPATAASDVYALGCILYQLLVERLPHARGGRSVPEIVRDLGKETIERPSTVLRKDHGRLPEPLRMARLKSISRDLDLIVLKALHAEAQRRYASARELAEDLQRLLDSRPVLARPDSTAYRASRFIRRNRLPVAAAAAIILALANQVWLILRLPQNAPGPPASPLPAAHDVSIAVLPFENLSRDPDNAYFTSGIQDEILTRLAGISALRVISRSSIEKYRSHPENLRTVAAELGVTNILEGTVQKAGDAVHINLQLIDATTDTHLWAQSYDRTLQDVFAVEGEVAETVAGALKLALLPEESRRLARAPTQNPVAYNHFLKAEYRRGLFYNSSQPADRTAAEQEYQIALAADPGFALVCAGYSQLLSWAYFLEGEDRSAVEIERARVLAGRALQLQPDLAEAHLALAAWLYRSSRDYVAAIPEARRALALKPSSSEALLLLGSMYKRQGRLDEAAAIQTEASRIDPRDALPLGELAFIQMAQRRYAEARGAAERARAIDPEQLFNALNLSTIVLLDHGDLDQAQAVIEAIPAPLQQSFLVISYRATSLLAYRRQFARAEALLAAFQASAEEGRTRQESVAWLQWLDGRAAAARQTARPLRQQLLATIARDAGNPAAHGSLSRVDLILGDNATALAEAARAVALMPTTLDVFAGSDYLVNLAVIQAQAGDAGAAVSQLDRLLTLPAGAFVSTAMLRLDPDWDPIRNDPRFTALVGRYQAAERSALSD
jgi:serine/threonine protein kinase/Tfp pilus assembly protein PilF